MRIFLSVGHSILRNGGTTSAVGYKHEYRFNKEFAPYVKRELEKQGHQVDLIVCPEYKFTVWYQEKNFKLPIANSGKYDLVVELHLNASNGAGHGTEVLYYPSDKRGLALSNRICNEYNKLGFRNRGAKARNNLYMITETRPTALIIESFFCDNRNDSNLFDRIGFERLAKALTTGITGLPCNNGNEYKPKSNETHEKAGYSVRTDTPNDVLNVREKADYNSRIVSSYRDKSVIYVHEVVKNKTGCWNKVEYHKGKFGYVSCRYCREIK